MWRLGQPIKDQNVNRTRNEMPNNQCLIEERKIATEVVMGAYM